MLTPEMIAKQLETMRLIDSLRAAEASSVTILCDNPDFGPNCAIEVSDDWTDYEQKRFTGETVLDALRSAVEARDIAAEAQRC